MLLRLRPIVLLGVLRLLRRPLQPQHNIKMILLKFSTIRRTRTTTLNRRLNRITNKFINSNLRTSTRLNIRLHRNALTLNQTTTNVSNNINLLVRLTMSVTLTRGLHLRLLVLHRQRRLIRNILPRLNILRSNFRRVRVIIFLIFRAGVPLLEMISLGEKALVRCSPS